MQLSLVILSSRLFKKSDAVAIHWREKLSKLETELFAQLQQQKQSLLKTERLAEIGKLRSQIAEIDRKEHPIPCL